MAWRHITVPLTQGRDGGSSDFAVVPATQDLLAATNVVYTQKGAIRGRPGTISLDGTVIAYDKTPVSGSSLATPLGTYQAQALHVDQAGRPLLQTFGRLFRREGTSWIDVGACYSLKRTTYAVNTSFQVQDYFGQFSGDPMVAAMDMGANIAGRYAVGGNNHASNAGLGFAVYNSKGQVLGPAKNPGTATTGPNITNLDGRGASAANNGIFWIDGSSLNKVGCLIYSGTYPTSISADLTTDATINAYTQFNYQRIWAAWDGTNYYVAYISGTAPNDSVKIIKVSPAGAVLSSLTYTTTTTILSVCLAVDSVTGKGLLAFTTTGASQVRTQAFTLSTMADLAIPTTNTPVNTTNTVGAVCAIYNGQGYYAWHGHPVSNNGASTLEIATRSLTTTTSTVCATYGSGSPTPVSAKGGLYADNSSVGFAWVNLFAPVVVAGRLLLGIQNSVRQSGSATNVISPCTWAVVDITDITSNNYPYVVAAGDNEDCIAAARAASASVVNGSLLFAVAQGVQFSAFGITQANFTPILLTPQGAPSAQSGQHLILGGVLPTIYDGYATYEAGWVGRPVMGVTVNTSIGGFTAGSWTFQAVWVYTDGAGQISRSLPSRPVTVTSAGSFQAQVVVAAPLLSNKFSALSATTEASLVCELYAAGPNPASTTPLTLFGKVTVDSRPNSSNSAVAATFTGPLNGTPQIYTTGGILADERPGGADRGVVVVDNRIWTADEHTLYASHTRTINVAPAWNTEEFFIDVPEVFGRVQGLAAIDDKVVAVCDNGVLAVNGPGLDDTGSGQGWSEPERVSMIGSAGPARSVCSHPDGGAYIGLDGVLYGISRSLAVQPLGMAVRDVAETGCDLVFVPPAQTVGWDVSSNPLLVYGTTNLKVLDLTNGQWALWSGLTVASLAGGAQGLIAMTAGSPYVVQYSASGGLDLGVAFSMSIRLRPQETSQENLMSGWGRVRAVNPVFKTLGAHTISVQVYADEESVKIMDKSFSVPG